MKEFIKKWLLLTVMIVYAANLVPAIWNGQIGDDSVFLLELLLLAALLCLVQMITNRWKSRWYLLELLVEYISVILLVSVFGLVAEWFNPSNLWMVLCYVTPVYVVGYFLDLARTRRDVELINEKIKQRREAARRGEQDEAIGHTGKESE